MSDFDRVTILLRIKEQLSKQIASMQGDLQGLHDANASNAKSTAGDKHDTERAMVHMEMETLSKRIASEKRTLHLIEELERSSVTEKIQLGSIVRTNTLNFFIGASFGKLSIAGSTIIGISSQSPLGQQMIGLKRGDTASVNGSDFQVIELL